MYKPNAMSFKQSRLGYDTGMISDGHGRWHENRKTFTLPLKGGDPPLRSEAHTGAEKGTIELVDLVFFVLRMFHPRNLCSHNRNISLTNYIFIIV